MGEHAGLIFWRRAGLACPALDPTDRCRHARALCAPSPRPWITRTGSALHLDLKPGNI
jgi:hypothetical protein